MKSLIPIISAGCLIVAAIFLIGERAADGSRQQSADSRSNPSITNLRSHPSSASLEQGVLRSRAGKAASNSTPRLEVQRVIEQMNLLLSGGIDLDTESPGAIRAANSASKRLRDELLVEFRKAGGTSGELLEWLSGITARGGNNAHLLKRIIHDTVVEASSTPGRAAVDWLVSQSDSDFITAYLFEQATRSWLRADQIQALRWLDRNMDRFEGHGVRFVVSEWPKDDVAGARDWVETRIATEGYSIHPSSVSDVARMWARQDPAGVFDWISGLDDRWQDWAVLGIAQGLPDEDLPAAADWLEENRDVGRELDSIRSTVAKRIAESDPRTAIALAGDITNLAESEKVIITAAHNLYIIEPELALRWLPESGLTKATQSDIVSGE